jgi:UDP-glucose:(heptosyl)LPS alpha-1,3-glucosyltransferase
VKLAFCLFKYFPFGGLQRDFLRIAKECLLRGHEVDVFTMEWEGEQESGLSITLLPSPGRQNHVRTKQFAEAIIPYVQNHDLVIGFNKMPHLDVYYAADTCYQAKARTQRGSWYRLTPRYRQMVAAETAVFSSQLKTHILLISSVQQTEYSRFYATPAERFYLLPPGIARDRMAPVNATEIRQSMRASLNVRDNDYVLLFIGSGFKTKGLDRALLSIAALPKEMREKTHLYIVGQDTPTLFLRQAKKQGIIDRIHFLGGRNDVSQLLLAGDLLLHPAYNENTGTVLLEALVAGLPVLTSDVCGYAQYIQKAQAGYVIPSPFCQKKFNQMVSYSLLSDQRFQWQKNAIDFSHTADIYNMPSRAADFLESLKGKKN